jgi:hypothetical protein
MAMRPPCEGDQMKYCHTHQCRVIELDGEEYCIIQEFQEELLGKSIYDIISSKHTSYRVKVILNHAYFQTQFPVERVTSMDHNSPLNARGLIDRIGWKPVIDVRVIAKNHREKETPYLALIVDSTQGNIALHIGYDAVQRFIEAVHNERQIPI